MALLEQWRSKRSWFFDGLVAIAGGVIGLGGLFPALVPVSEGTLAAPRDHSWEHPLRRSILSTLERSPGIHYRDCLLYTSPSPRDLSTSRMPSSA